MVHPSQQRPLARTQPAAIILARNGTIRTFKVRPGLLALVFGGFALFSTAYFAAAAYMFLRDDLLGAALSRQVEMQYSYEDRIAALRAELDRVTSRHAVETLGVEEQLSLLLDRQSLIAERQSTLDELVARASDSGVVVATARVPRTRPVLADIASAAEPDTAPEAAEDRPLAYAASAEKVDDIITGTLLRRDVSGESARPILRDVRASLDELERDQSGALDALSAAAADEAERIRNVLTPLDIEPDEAGTAPQGGPFIAAGDLHFVEKAALLRRSLDEVAGLRRAAATAPLASPLTAAPVSSRFGYRVDPFLGRPALHAGIDFVASSGTLVRATAPGVVTAAGRNGGYGNMVEIRHSNGLSTRYGHMSAILVKKGDIVEAGALIGRVGSTGRSTGPHLHYEMRSNGEAIDPAAYLAAGRAL